MSPKVARFLLGLLNQQQLTIGAPDFDAAVEDVLAARRELREIIDESASASEPA